MPLVPYILVAAVLGALVAFQPLVNAILARAIVAEAWSER